MSRRRSCWLLPLAALSLALAVPAALADGDPASDYLLSGPSFLSPYDGHIPAAEQATINAMLASAKAKGFPIRLALIVTPYDLGSVPILFDKPKIYAKFLGEEDYYYWKDELLVVMPNGYGIYKASDLPAADKAALAALPKLDTRSGPALALAAETALRALAAKHNITLSASGAGSGGSSTWTDRAEIAGGALVLCLLGFAGWALWRRRRHA
jgi:hypothetical protein